MVTLNNFNEGNIVLGPETDMTDFAVLSNDPTGNLPSSFTICNSFFIKYITGRKVFVTVWQKDGRRSFLSFEINGIKNYKTFVERVHVFFNESESIFATSGLPITPHAWYHGCIAIDTIAGNRRVVINGFVIVDEVNDAIKNSLHILPKSLSGRITLYKTKHPGIFYQSRGTITNMNVFQTALSIDQMNEITNGSECGLEGNYLSWNRMEWNISGTVRKDTVEKGDLCQERASPMVLLTESFPIWEECMQFCPKLRGARSPVMRKFHQFMLLHKWILSAMINPKTKKNWPGIFGRAIWMSSNDMEEEGVWKDFYTGDLIEDTSKTLFGELNGGDKENCGFMIPTWNGWSDWLCELQPNAPVHCLCEHNHQMYLQLRGLCIVSFLDKYFVPSNKPGHGSTIFNGLRSTVIEYSEEDSVWTMTFHGKAIANTTAITDASRKSFLLGSHMWTITKDHKDCSVSGKPYTTILKLTGCGDGEFTCRDGQCIRDSFK